MEADGMVGIGADKTETLDRIADLLFRANGAALAVEDDFLTYLISIALLHVSEARADTVGFASRRLVS